ncbi:Acyl-CoA N-acyltransferase [Penicillium malachiteum]|uniref:Acyl-CoA N-acyltransferase n=1 Tax=Penicillium malachiteum TaxID=1324776 RepID=A0AAD6HML5_9EURO|nr:Acyl-CoA N-acyltransferase [Penicillium malachiteum]
MVGQTSDSTLELKSNKLPLSLRLPTFDDVPAAVEILANKANSEFDKSICDATPEELDAVATRWTIVTDPPVYRNFLVFYEDKPVGITGFGWIGPCDESQGSDDSSLAGAAGIIVQPLARGKGIAYEALRLVFEYGFRELGLKEIRVGSHSGNLPMWMLMERKFGVKTIKTAEVDRFGNDLLWIITRPEEVL